MTKVVLDTNVVISSVIRAQGAEARIFDLSINRVFELYASQPILNEYKNVLARPKFGLSANQVSSTKSLIASSSALVRPTRKLKVCLDEPDNRFLECAESAKANYLVTGNKRDFPKQWKNTRVVNARELLEEIALKLKR